MEARKQIEAMVARAREYLLKQQYDQAENLLKDGLNRLGAAAVLYNYLGVVYTQKENYKEAIECFRQSYQTNPEYVEALLNWTICLCDLGQYEEAERLYQELYSPTRTTQAQDVRLTDLVKGRIANKYKECGLSFRQIGKFTEATSEFKKALALKKNLPDVRIELARTYLEMQQLDLAANELDELMSHHRSNTEGLVLMGLLHHKKGQKRAAILAWEKALKIDPLCEQAKAFLSVHSSLGQ